MSNGRRERQGERGTNRNWIGTYHLNQQELEEEPDRVLANYEQILREMDPRRAVFQLEAAPSTGRLHIQFYISFKNPVRLGTVKSVFNGCHAEFRQRSDAEAARYCSKDESRVAGPIVIGKALEQGKRSDLQELYDAIKSGKRFKDLYDIALGPMVRYTSGILKLYNLMSPKRETKTEVYIHYGVSGGGKTSKVFRDNPRETIFVLAKPPTKSAVIWWDGYDPREHDVVLIDEFYGWLAFNSMLLLMDEYPCQVQVKGGFMNFSAKKLYITSNIEWNRWYKFDEFQDPEEARYSFRRRVNHILHFPTRYNPNEPWGLIMQSQ